MPRRKRVSRSVREAQSRERSLAALGRMRRDGTSLSQAAKAEGVKPNTVRKYVGSALKREGQSGRFHASKGDNFKRHLYIPTALGPAPVPIYGSKDASAVAEYLNAVAVYLRTGKATQLKRFKGKSFGKGKQKIELITDPKTLSALAGADALHFDQLYAAIAGAP
jgi:hypothetical protein